MSDPSDDRPIAPPRSLGRPAGQTAPTSGPGADPTRSSQQPQPAMSAKYAGGSSSYSSGEAHTERSLPVPPMPAQPTGGGTAQRPPAQQSDSQSARAAKRARASAPRTVRRAKLRVVRVDPWSVTKASLLLSIAFGIMCVVAVFLIFSIMNASGLWDSVNNTIQGVLKQKPADQFDIKEYVGMSRIMGITMLISAIDVIIITALATLGAFIYNMAASLLGGVEVTLAEDLR
jgi:hypothetical protein